MFAKNFKHIKMKIAIIGTGNIGSVLATHWAKAGHQLYLGIRDIKKFKGKHLLDLPNTSGHSLSAAVGLAEVVLVATPAHIAPELIGQLGELPGKVVIDATNAVRTKPEPYPTAYHAFADLTEAEVVKCFNCTGFENMEDPQYGDLTLDMFMAGASERAKAIAKQLAVEAGFAECYDFGGEAQVELLEQFALSWINLAIFQKMGRKIGFKLLMR